MAESKFEQVVASFETELGAIKEDGGTTYWYTPTVVRVDAFNDQQNFDPSRGSPIYMVRDTGDENQTDEVAAYDETTDDYDVYVMVAMVDNRGDTNPFTTPVASGTLRNRMIQDVVNKLEGNFNRGGLAYDTRKGLARRDFIEPEGWILGEVHFTVTVNRSIGTA